jgi:hypothetical protein
MIQLDIEKAEHDARRDYEYEARKRLYQEYEPIFFQLQNYLKVHLEEFML